MVVFYHFSSLQVEVELESVDKGGNFIGWLWVEGVMLNVSLVEHGLAKVHFSAERSAHYAALSRAEDKARQERLNLWSLEIVDSTGSEHAKEEVSADREDSRSNGLEEEKSKNSSSKVRRKGEDKSTQLGNDGQHNALSGSCNISCLLLLSNQSRGTSFLKLLLYCSKLHSMPNSDVVERLKIPVKAKNISS